MITIPIALFAFMSVCTFLLIVKLLSDWSYYRSEQRNKVSYEDEEEGDQW